MSLTTRVLLGLGLGLAVGILLATVAPPSWHAVAHLLEPIGTLWTRALQMTVIPLVATLLFTGAAAGGRDIGRLGARGFAFFLVTLVAVVSLTLSVAPQVFAVVHIDPVAAAALRADAGATTTPAVPGFREWLVGLVPTNLAAALAGGAMLPIILAMLLFGAAAGRLPVAQRGHLEQFAEAVGATTIVVVRWVLALAPIGVFALAAPLALRLGVGALGAVGAYVIITAAMSLVAIALMYPVARLGGVTLRQFAAVVAPAQGIAVSARSSLAALPALIEGAADLGLSDRITGFFLPFSTSLFRLGAAVALPAGVLFIARLYDVPLGGTELVTIGVTSVILSFSVPGIPGGSILIMAPVLQAVGLPIEGVGILLGVDTIPDMFRTTTNVTGSMAAAVVVGGRERA
ncbi:MAG: dicarboxylate/amino acid:cation symporter [Phycisphaerales bacterium]